MRPTLDAPSRWPERCPRSKILWSVGVRVSSLWTPCCCCWWSPRPSLCADGIRAHARSQRPDGDMAGSRVSRPLPQNKDGVW